MNAKKGVSRASARNRDDDFITTIQILDSTRNRLKRAYRKDQTYDDKINQLLDYATISSSDHSNFPFKLFHDFLLVLGCFKFVRVVGLDTSAIINNAEHHVGDVKPHVQALLDKFRDMGKRGEIKLEEAS